MKNSDAAFYDIFPNGCPLGPICRKSLSDKDLDGCIGKNNDQCSKGQRVIIELLNDILSELTELNKRIR